MGNLFRADSQSIVNLPGKRLANVTEMVVYNMYSKLRCFSYVNMFIGRAYQKSFLIDVTEASREARIISLNMMAMPL